MYFAYVIPGKSLENEVPGSLSIECHGKPLSDLCTDPGMIWTIISDFFLQSFNLFISFVGKFDIFVENTLELG